MIVVKTGQFLGD